MKFGYATSLALSLGITLAAVVPVKPAVNDTPQQVKNGIDVVCNAFGCIPTTTRSTTTATVTPYTTPIVRLGARAVVPPKPAVPAPKPVAPKPAVPKPPSKVEMINIVKDVLERVCDVGECKTTTRKITTRVPKPTSSSKTPVRLGATPKPTA